MIRLQQNGSNQNTVTVRTSEGDYSFFFSYETIVAFRVPGNGFWQASDYKWSRTTSRHVNGLPNVTRRQHGQWRDALYDTLHYSMPQALRS